MSPYTLALWALIVALLSQSVAAGQAMAAALGKPYRRGWVLLAVGCGLLALHHGYSLELAVRTGLYDLRQAALSAGVGLCLVFGLSGLRAR